MSDSPMIIVENLSKTFKLPHEKVTSVKGLFVSIFNRKNKSFELQKALSEISFEVQKGEFFGIVGRNGSGKSTLLKMLAGIYTPTQGHIAINGKLTPFIELGVGFNPELTGRENVFLNGALLGFNRKEMEAMYKGIVKFAELERFMDQKLKNYSSGMQVRLAFSIAIRAKSDILLIDEVLAVGDAAFQQKCFDYFEELKKEGQTVVFVSHDMSALRRFCDRAIYLESGKLLYNGKPSDIADEYLVKNIDTSDPQSGKKSQSDYKVKGVVKNRTDTSLDYEVSYSSKSHEPMYVGISVLRDKVSVAEITTPQNIKLTGSGRVTYTLDTTIFNGGVYELSAVLCRKKGRKLLALTNSSETFVIKGSDITRGAAIKLEDGWREK